uniref:Uncharacterized protein n=1 Tax=Amphimedon queenslandica TaxID=400682 RepID=A0A1X7VL20_AMPQE
MKRKVCTIMDFWGSKAKISNSTKVEAINEQAGLATNYEVVRIQQSPSTSSQGPEAAASLLSSNETSTFLVVVLDISKQKPHRLVQPVIKHPQSMFGSVGIGLSRVGGTAWLEYSTSPDPTFKSIWFRDWKHALGKGVLSIHSSLATHTEAMLNWNGYKKRIDSDSSVVHVVQLDRLGAKVIADNRKYVESLMEGVLYCAEQGISLRGHDESESSSNYKSLLTKVISQHSSEVDLMTKENLLGPPAFQNEIIHFLANKV